MEVCFHLVKFLADLLQCRLLHTHTSEKVGAEKGITDPLGLLASFIARDFLKGVQ